MASTDPNLGLTYGWTLGESGWHTTMDGNLKRLGAVVGLAVRPIPAIRRSRRVKSSNPARTCT